MFDFLRRKPRLPPAIRLEIEWGAPAQIAFDFEPSFMTIHLPVRCDLLRASREEAIGLARAILDHYGER